MFTKFSIRILSSLLIILMLSISPVIAIQVTYVGVGSGGSTELWDGETHYGQAEFDEPYHTVHWYVKGAGETGFGTEVSTDYGDGTSTVSYFSHTFSSSGSYEITAYVYPESGNVDWSSYTVDVYNKEDAINDLENQIINAESLEGEFESLKDEIESSSAPPSVTSSILSGIGYSILSLTGVIVTGSAAVTTLTTGGAATPLTYVVAISGLGAASTAGSAALVVSPV